MRDNKPGGGRAVLRAWTEVPLYLVSPVGIYLAALAIVRPMGKRALGQLSLFDLVVMAGIGDIIVVVGLERRVPIRDGLFILAILGGLEALLSFLTFRGRKAVLEACGKISVIPREEEDDLGRVLEELAGLRRDVVSLAERLEKK